MKTKKIQASKPRQKNETQGENFSTYKSRAAIKTALLYFGCRQVISILSEGYAGPFYWADEDDGSENGGFECPILTHVVVSFDNRKWLDQLTGTCGDVVDLWAFLTFATREEAVFEMMEILDYEGTDHEENGYLMGNE